MRRDADGRPAEGWPELSARLQEALDAIAAEVAPPASGAGGSDRPLEELVETYRPRQPELLELLRDEGEITVLEYERLRTHLEHAGAGDGPDPQAFRTAGGEPPVTERPIAAAPLAQDRTPSTPRPAADLIRLYRIESIKQAGAVRARRQISYEEYMALKRHFQAAEAAETPAAPAPRSSEAEATDRRE